jgi:hypothetical protein
MSVHVEWAAAAGITAQVLPPGTELPDGGTADPREYTLALTENEVMAITGTLRDLFQLSARIDRALADAINAG